MPRAGRGRHISNEHARCRMFVRELLSIIDLHRLGWTLSAAEAETIRRAREHVTDRS